MQNQNSCRKMIKTNNKQEMRFGCFGRSTIVLMVALITLALTYFCTAISMSGNINLPFFHIPDQWQLSLPSLLVLPSFTLFGTLILICNRWLAFPSYIISMPFIACVVTIFPYAIQWFGFKPLPASKIVLFYYGMISGTLLLIYIILMTFKYIKSIVSQTE